MLRGNKTIGIVKEIYSKWERRSPLTPMHVKQLVDQHGLKVLVQPSNKRVFADSEFEKAGAVLTEDLNDASVIFGVKQVPINDLLPERTYVFFSHTIKAQPENMQLLDALLEKNIRLIDYECITAGGNRAAPRLVAFGEYAGKAGMIDTFRGLGERMLAMGYSSPFLSIGSAYMYPDFKHSCEAVAAMGRQIEQHGVPPDFAPMVFVFTGNGNVSRGAQEVFKHTPHEMITADQLGKITMDPHKLYGCIVEEEHMVAPLADGAQFSRSEYYQHPERYEGVFHDQVAPHASVIVNCTYWDNRYPRLMTVEQLQNLKKADNCRLVGVADISCDIGGSLEFLQRDSQIEDPFFLYNPETNTTSEGLDGDGVMMLGVDILPSELPREASHHFGELLTPFVPALSASDGTLPFDAQQEAGLPAEMHGAVITAHGELTPSYTYIEKMRRESERAQAPRLSSAEMQALAGSTVLQLNGHLYDTGLINQALNLIEDFGGRFTIVNQEVSPNMSDGEHDRTYAGGSLQVTSTVSVQVTVEQGREELEQLISSLQTLASNTPRAEASVFELSDFCKGDFGATLVAPKFTKDAAAMSFGQAATPAAATAAAQNVLILGAGLVAAPAVEYLSRDPNRHVVVASAVPSEAEQLVRKMGRANVSAITLDATAQPDELDRQISRSQAVLSLIPAPLHPQIASSCIRAGVNLVTASYVSPEMASLEEEAKAAGVSILCEMGLDPGMDHMSAKQVIDEVHQQGGRITSFTSVCGGLPAPEAANNPLAYKFSWSPRGVLTAAQNASSFKWEGETVHVPGEDLLGAFKPIKIVPSLSLENLPNRNALPYAELYGIPDAHTIYRGTLRYAGWSSIMHNFKQVGLLEQDTRQLPDSWPELCSELAIDSQLTDEARDCLRWLGVFEQGNQVAQRGTVMDAFCALLEDKLAYGKGERDMALMYHEFGVESGSGQQEKLTSTFMAYGTPDGDTVMAKTVGLTAAVGVELVLQGELSSGVLTPMMPSVYKPGLQKLEGEGIIFTETRTVL